MDGKSAGFAIRRMMWVGMMLAGVVGMGTGCGRSEIQPGKSFQDAAQFEQLVTEEKYVVLGRFEEAWPATIASVVHGRDEVTLTIPGQTPHVYSGFTGYKLMAVVMETEAGGGSGFVLRSRDK